MSEKNNDLIKNEEKTKEGGDIQTKVGKEDLGKLPRPVIKIENIIEEEEYSKEEYDEFLKLYSETLTEINEGEIVKGRILSINDKEVSVDIGFKSEGNIPSHEFDSLEDLRVGEEIEVFLDNVEDGDGQLVLSKKKADFTRVWEKLMETYESGETIEGKCLRRIKGGIVVDLMGIDAFLPGSQIDVKPIRDFDAFIGQTLPLRVVKVNNLRKNIVVSRRVLIEGNQAEQREKILAKLEKGKVLEGTVKNITDFGVFVDLGGVDGLLHITDLSWGRVSHPSEIVSLDERIKVVILDFDDNKERISLGLKQLTPHPWENIDEKYSVGQRFKGKAVSITDYGVFVELEKGIEGLVHISEMSWTQHIKHPSKFISVGEELEVVILNIDKEEKKISMGLKQIEPDPWLTIEEKYAIGTQHKGKVINITDFGAFVELEEGADGLIHISDLSWTKKVRHPSEMVNKGDEINVMILGISKKDRRISLGHKQIEENPWDRFEALYKKDTKTKGKVVRSIEKGLIVELPEKVEGFVPFSQLQKFEGKTKDKEKSFEEGNELLLTVIEFNKNQKKIVLSYDKYVGDSEKKEVEEFVKTQEEKKKSTIGEILSGDGETVIEEKSEKGEAVKDEGEKAVAKEPEEKLETKEGKSEAEIEEKPEEKAEVEKELKEKAEVEEKQEEKAEIEEKPEEKAVIEEKSEKDEAVKDEGEKAVAKEPEEKLETKEEKSEAEIEEKTEEKAEVEKELKEKVEVEEKPEEKAETEEKPEEKAEVEKELKEKAEIEEKQEEKAEVEEKPEEKAEVEKELKEKVEVEEKPEEKAETEEKPEEKTEVEKELKEKVEVEEKQEEKAEVEEEPEEKAEVKSEEKPKEKPEMKKEEKSEDKKEESEQESENKEEKKE